MVGSRRAATENERDNPHRGRQRSPGTAQREPTAQTHLLTAQPRSRECSSGGPTRLSTFLACTFNSTSLASRPVVAVNPPQTARQVRTGFGTPCQQLRIVWRPPVLAHPHPRSAHFPQGPRSTSTVQVTRRSFMTFLPRRPSSHPQPAQPSPNMVQHRHRHPLSPAAEQEAAGVVAKARHPPSAIAPRHRSAYPKATSRNSPTIVAHGTPISHLSQWLLFITFDRYFDQDEAAGRVMTQILNNVAPSQRALYSRLQASVRSAFHASVNARRHAEFQAHICATQPGGSLMPHSRANPSGPMARKERFDRLDRFVRTWCTMGMPGTKPFFEALWAVMRLQVLPENLGGAGDNKIQWELDDAVFKEAAYVIPPSIWPCISGLIFLALSHAVEKISCSKPSTSLKG